jgi:hypothetical protein
VILLIGVLLTGFYFAKNYGLLPRHS